MGELIRLRAACGLALGPLGWALHHQFGSSFSFADCHAASAPVLAGTGLLGLALAAGGGLVSWRAFAARPAPPDGFIALLGVMAGGLFSLTLVIQVLAALVVPACFR